MPLPRTRSIELPQTIVITREGRTLDDAFKSGTFPNMRDERDEPGTREDGVSRLDPGRYSDSGVEHPVPQLTSAYPQKIHLLHRSGMFRSDRTIEVIQVTETVMTPPVAEAFVQALAEDPTHPFVQTHLMPGIDLNGSDSYLSIGGPAFAIPLTYITAEPNARRRKDYQPQDRGTTPRQLEVRVKANDGLVSEDFFNAVRRHRGLVSTEIVVGHPEVEELLPLQHLVQSGRDGELTGRERPMFKLTKDGATVGFFESPEDAQAAVQAAVEGVKYRSWGYVSDRSYSGEFAFDFKVEGCLVEDGAEVRRAVSTVLVEAEATLSAEVADVAPGRGGDVAGWMFVWQAYNWHRHVSVLQQELDEAGAVVRQYHA